MNINNSNPTSTDYIIKFLRGKKIITDLKGDPSEYPNHKLTVFTNRDNKY